MASTWDNVLPSLVTSLFDKAILGGVLAVVGFWFQKRLEIFKRDQGLAAEWAKSRIAAYNRVFAAVNSMDAIGGVLLMTTRETHRLSQADIEKMHEEFEHEIDALIALLRTERHLLGPSFTGIVTAYALKFRGDVKAALSDAPPIVEDEFERRATARESLRAALEDYLPPFARAPEGDRHFSAPDIDHSHLEALRLAQALRKQSPKKGEAP